MLQSMWTWFDLTRAIAAAGLIISLTNIWFTWQSRKLANEQEKRRRPRLIPSLVNGFFRDEPGSRGRIYAFLITITNPTDTNNSIVEADLSITYLTSDRI